MYLSLNGAHFRILDEICGSPKMCWLDEDNGK